MEEENGGGEGSRGERRGKRAGRDEGRQEEVRSVLE